MDEVLVNEDIVEISAADMPLLTNILSSFPGHKLIKSAGDYVHMLYPIGTANLESINRYCFENGVTLNHLQLKKKSLEAKFFELTNN